VEFLVVFVVLAVVVVVVTSPLRPGRTAALQAAEDAERDELEAEREAKYREIRDAEMDHRTGKLSDADWRALDRTLRGEAVEILRRIDALDAAGGTPLP
jgi:membrane protein implicated in regulation of membrane protease activity